MGRLIFLSGAQDIQLNVCQGSDDLYRARFYDSPPILHIQAGTIHIQPATRMRPQIQQSHPTHPMEICLNNAIPWEIEFRGPITNLQADLRGLRLRSMDFLGDASQTLLFLPHTEGTSYLYIAGAFRDSAIHRPSMVGMRIHAAGGIEELRFDHQLFRAVRAETSLESTGFSPEEGYYDLTITGSAKSVTFASSL